MKKLLKISSLVLFLLMLLMACNTVESDDSGSGEESLSLNGYWKFNSFIGDGANSLNIKPGGGDVVIDNTQNEFLEMSGKWELATEPQRESKCWGENYYHRSYHTLEDSSFIRFKTGKLKSGYYEHFIFFPWGHHNAAIVNVKHSNGLFSLPFNQRNRTNTWLSLGAFQVDKKSYIEFTSYTKGMVSADVVMLRPIEEKDYLAIQQEKKDLVKTSYNDSHWQNLMVPGHFGMINEYSNYSGQAWYRTEVKPPKSWKEADDERIRVRFEGVYHVSRIFFNGNYLGKHQGGFTPFEFDITDKINFDGKNVLAVEADNSYTVGATWNWGGIIRDVTLIKNKDVHIKFQYIHAEPDLVAGTADYKIKVRIENNSSNEKSLDVEAVIVKDSPIAKSTKKIQVAAHGLIEFELEGKLTAKQVKLWHFDRPELYDLITSVKEDGKLLHTKTDRFGIRKFEATDSQMLLNGEPVRLAGFNRVSDHRYWGSSEPLELLQLDVDLMKTAGANFMRIMHGTQNKKLLELCDEKGILIFEEANIRDIRNPQFTQPDYGYAKQWIREMIERDANHPCIVGWSTGNELTDHWDYVKTTYEYAKELDPYRMALHVSNQGYKKGENATNNPLNYGDMIFQNIYQNNPGAIMDTLRLRWPKKAMFISEFGWATLSRFTNDGLDNDFEELGSWYDFLRGERPYTTGASIWTYNDYRSGYTQSLPCENRAWGFVNTWRTKRRYFHRHSEENSPVKSMSIEDVDLEAGKANVEIEVRGVNDFPSFAMKNYTLKYTFRNIAGEVLAQNETDLPDLYPGIEPWNDEISWTTFNVEPFEFHVELISTNGYTRRENKIHFKVPSRPTINDIKVSTDKIRVYFEKKLDAFEYFVKYEIAGIEKQSYKTIANYIDLDSLPAGEDINLQLVASNSKGVSEASESIEVNIEGKILPPIVWDGFIANNQLVVGYSGAWEDETYSVRFGTIEGQLDRTKSTNARGMLTAPLNGEASIYFQIMRTTKNGTSQWSNIVEAKEGKFRIYE